MSFQGHRTAAEPRVFSRCAKAISYLAVVSTLGTDMMLVSEMNRKNRGMMRIW